MIEYCAEFWKKIKRNKRFKEMIMQLILLSICITIVANRTIVITDFYTLVEALNGNNIAVIVLFLISEVLLLRFLKEDTILNDYIPVGRDFPLALIFAICMWLGYNVANFKRPFYGQMNGYKIFFDLVNFVGYIALFYIGLFLLFKFVQKNRQVIGHIGAKNTRNYFNVIKKIFILLLVWGVYFAIFFPGIFTIDSYMQLREILGDSHLTDAHPFMHTLLSAFFIRIGAKMFGNIYYGISLMTIFQMVCFAAVIVYMDYFCEKRGVNSKLRKLIFAFYLVNPIVGAHSVTLWKDIWISHFVLLYIIFLVDLMDDKREYISKKKWIGFILVMLGVLFSKGTGILIIGISIPFVMWSLRKYWKQYIIAILVCFCFFFGFRKVIMTSMQIPHGNTQDTMTTIMQPIARVIVEHEDEISEEDKDIINEILPIKEVKEAYNPKIVDPVKVYFNLSTFLANKPRYLGLWLHLGRQYPSTYFFSFLNSSYGYWYPETRNSYVSSSDYVNIVKSHWGEELKCSDPDINNYILTDRITIIKPKVSKFINSIGQFPIIGIFVGNAIYFWISLVLFSACKKYKITAVSSVFSVIVAVFISCAMSPVYAEMRYAYPAIISCPFLCAIVVDKVTENMIINEGL